MNRSVHNIYWLLRREFWENRRLITGSWYLAALIIVLNVLFIAVTLIGHYSGHVKIHASNDDGSESTLSTLSAVLNSLSPHDVAQLGQALEVLMFGCIALFALALGASLISYTLSCLHDERRDRSILFWKCMPVTDTQTVLSKSLMALVVLPVSTLVAGLVAGWLSVLAYLLTLAVLGLPMGAVLAHTNLAMLTVIVLGALPVYIFTLLPGAAWIMLCSAIARRHPVLPALFIPALFALAGAMGLPNPVWRILVGNAIPAWLILGFESFRDAVPASATQAMTTIAPLYRTLAAPDFWIGIAAGIGLLGLIVLYRRRYTVLV